MLILALDTTTRAGSVAVTRDDEVLAIVPGNPSRTHGERLPGELAQALADAGVARASIDLLAVASGPGGFTGLRIGLAAMQGVAMTLDRPVVGVPTLDALAWEAGRQSRLAAKPLPRLVVPWMDAQRGDVFSAVYAPSADDAWPWRLVATALADAPAAVLAEWRSAVGDAPAVFIGDAVERDAVVLSEIAAERLAPGPLAPAVAQLGARLAAAGKAGPPHALEPIYVRRPDAEIERERRGRP